MVEGFFAGYKLLHDARWNGEYLVYDKDAYENRDGSRDLPIHTTKELYVPVSTPDSIDEPDFQFPVRDGQWVSMAPLLNRYVRGRRSKTTRPKTSGDATAQAAPGGITAEEPASSPPFSATDGADAPGEFLQGDGPDMFEELLKNLNNKYKTTDSLAEASAESGGSGPESDIWVRRGEYIIRRHNSPSHHTLQPC